MQDLAAKFPSLKQCRVAIRKIGSNNICSCSSVADVEYFCLGKTISYLHVKLTFLSEFSLRI